MTKIKEVSEVLFRVIVLFFSAVLMIMSLLAGIDLAAANDEAVKLQSRINELKAENAELLAQRENRLSLEEIEDYAVSRLGMQRCLPGQVYYIDYEG